MSKEDHMALFKYIDDLAKHHERTKGYDMKWVNHNLDVPILHFKINFSGQDF